MNTNKQIIGLVWLKARAVSGFDSRIVRKDMKGAWIQFSEFGNIRSQFGWEIDHIIPVVRGGGDELYNLQPLHWKNNRDKGDKLLNSWHTYGVTSK